jgi:uncharacterized glyoxalase superfamily protein PhnB
MPIVPYLYYRDVAKALAFLRKAFGATPVGDTVKDARGRITHGSVLLGDDMVMMGCPGRTFKNPKKLGQTTQNLYVEVADVDAHHARAKRAGAAILEAPLDTPYGHRRYAVEDPEGHHWYFWHGLAAGTPAKATRATATRAASRARKRPSRAPKR